MDRMPRAVLLLVAALLPLLASSCGGEVSPTSVGERSTELAVSPSGDDQTGAQPDESTAGAGAGASLDRKITQTASMSLQVKAVSEAFQEVGRITDGAGGFVASSGFSNEGDEQTASMTIHVPVARFQEVLASLRSLALKVENEESQSNDVTGEYTDLGSRLRNLQATEAQYLEFLKQAKDMAEVLQVQDPLTAVRGDIETAQGRINLLDSLTDMSTITVHLRPEAAPSPGGGSPNPLKAGRAAWHASLDTLRVLATAIVAVAVYCWWIVPLLVVLAVIATKLSPRPQRDTKQ